MTGKRVAWNKGLTNETDPRVAKYANSHKGKKQGSNSLKGRKCPYLAPRMVGDKNPMKRPEVLEKVSNALKGRPSWNKGLSKENNSSLAKLAESRIGSGNPMFGKHASEKQRKAISEAAKISMTEERRMRMSLAWQADNNPMRNPSVAAKTAKSMTGKFVGKKSPRYGIAPSPKTGRGKGAYFNHPNGKQVWLRSSYEVRFAEVITKLDMLWDYECKSFEIGDLGTYRPDFYLPNQDLWIEVKGYMQPKAKSKIERFIQLYPNEQLKIVWMKDIEYLESFIS